MNLTRRRIFEIICFNLMRSKNKKIALIVAAFLIIGLSFGLGVYFGYKQRPAIEKVGNMVGKEKPTALIQVDFNPFWQTWALLEEKYVFPEKIDRQKMIWGAIKGLTQSLGDPYTEFFPPEEKEAFEDEIRGDFEGVGMEIGIKKGILTVIAPLKDTPAFKAGVKAGDKILEINAEPTRDMTLREAVSKIRGKKGTAADLTIFREKEDKTHKISIIRDVIKIPVIETEEKGDVFIIKLFNFNQNSVFEFRNALRKLIYSGKNKLILDLRNNPGGFLEASVDIASWFLPMGDVVVQEDFGKGEKQLHRSKGYNIWQGRPLLVLVNQGSASASEILAGALQDHKIAQLMGEKTFGKGSVQELAPVTDKTALKITIAKWLTPNGGIIEEGGLKPDIEIEQKEDGDKDFQLEKAIEYLSKKN
ncbi:MAG: hypothetical protein A3H02_03180 [Candidatus Niyogibacteria bacterium RIFCSPLOWO2_12_FULL_41_13]|uniref:PDZ domain-containing protein n=1 Tax=Candidatus Niyogibacteria bacterium RIFCSPLOWO2_12_FULL_41_13 TaxID=1801726 RepID=A0A1G2F289_9BACT|nr:MAG: hypothetical protein A3H02_03180 [Candidatus Niyogibacteria bacterium RIFCSPLOWO2_12_FULL_41_13]